MKLKRIIALFLTLTAALMTAAFSITIPRVFAEEAAGGLRYAFPSIFNCVMEGKPTCTAEKGLFGDDEVVKVVPTPEKGSSFAPCLDSWSLAVGGKKADIAKYRFVSIEYFLSEDSVFEGSMVLNLLPGNTKALKMTANLTSTAPLVKGKAATAHFKLDGKTVLNPDSENTHINQIHLYPFGNTPASRLSAKDIIYIKSISFHESNPDTDATVTVTLEKGRENAMGKFISESIPANTEYILPECSYTVSNGSFSGWKDAEGNILSPGTKLTLTDRDVTFTAVWDIESASPDSVVLSFVNYQNGIVDGKKTVLSYEACDYDGVSAMRAITDPNGADNGRPLMLDGWSYSTALADLSDYGYMALLMRVDVDSDITVTPKVSIMKSADLTESFYATAKEAVKLNEWTFATFDITGAREKFIPTADRHIIKQIHISPLGSTPVSGIPGGTAVYVSKVMFFKEKPRLSFKASYVNGYPDGSFRPTGTIKRSEAVSMISGICGDFNKALRPSFSDISEKDWFYKAVSHLNGAGALGCFGNGGRFDSEKPITRAEFAYIILKTGLSKASSEGMTFTDVGKDHKFHAEISAATASGLINGYPDGSFKPEKSITRHEAVIILNRALGRSGKAPKHEFFRVFTDVDEKHGGFQDISAAAVSHIENHGEFLADARNPSEFIAENAAPDYSYGNALLKETDAKTSARIAEIKNAEDDHSSITGTVYYVSPSGDDSNNGLSPNSPLKTIAKINGMTLKKGDGVLFERGGIYRDEIRAKSGVTYAAYGEGAKPIISGSPEDGADASKWVLHHEKDGIKIWRYYREDYADIGNITFNGGELYAKREVPNYKNGGFYVRETDIPFEVEKHLGYDLCYFHKADSALETGGVPEVARARGPLYLRCDKGNPGEVFESIEFGTKRRGVDISGTADVTIDNLHIRYCGAAGIGGTGPVYNLTVTNCEAAFLGGTIQTYRFGGNTTGRVTRAGNGIETYGTTDGFTVKNCYVHDVYDAGLSHQVSSGGTQNVDMSNISYLDNVIENCVYGIEYFNGAPAMDGIQRTGTNILMEGNIIRFSGYGFGSTRPDGHCQAAIKSWDHRNEFENFVIRNNIFDRSMEYLLHISAKYPEWMPVMENNTYIQTFGKTFVNYRGEHPETSFDIISIAENIIGDRSAVAAYVSPALPDEEPMRTNLARFGVTEMYE